MDLEFYKQSLKSLLPKGRAWIHETGSRFLKLLYGFATELKRLDDRAIVLFNEALPYTTTELLGEWERITGLPDPDNTIGTIESRRQDLLSRLTSTGGATISYLQEVAQKLGFEIEIVEFRSFLAGRGRAGDRVSNPPWIYAFMVLVPSGQEADIRIQKLIVKLRPAHTVPIFKFGGLYFSAGNRCGQRLKQNTPYK